MLRLSLLGFCLLFCCAITAQKYSHFIYARQAAGFDKQLTAGGYAFGYGRICFNIGGGIANGSDHQFLRADQLNDNKAKQKIRTSLAFEPEPFPSNSYLEECSSTYSAKQLRAGFTVFIRHNDSLSRSPFTGPHAGVELVYVSLYENQTAIYKSNANEVRRTYSSSQHFSALGAATSVGWQFGMLRGHLLFDVRAVIPFYYPFVKNPNLNSPFAGTKYEAEVGLTWRFGMDRTKEIKGDDGGKVRDKL